MSNTLTLNNPLSESDWDKIFDVEFEKTKHIWYRTPSGKRVDFIRSDVLDKIRAEIEGLQKMCNKDDLNLMAQHSAFGMVLDVIDKYKAEQEDEE